MLRFYVSSPSLQINCARSVAFTSFLQLPQKYDSPHQISPSSLSLHHQNSLLLSLQIRKIKNASKKCFLCFCFRRSNYFQRYSHSLQSTTSASQGHSRLGFAYPVMRRVDPRWRRKTGHALRVGRATPNTRWTYFSQSQRPHWNCAGIFFNCFLFSN